MLPTIRFFLLMLFFTILAGFFIVPSRPLPDYAIVYLDDQHHTYLSPACAGREQEKYRRSTAAEARKLKYEPEKKCQDQGGFTQEGRSITGNALVRMGLLPQLPNRWNPDGTWNW